MPEAGIRFLPVTVSGLSRSNPLKAARAVLQALGAVAAAWRILGRERPGAVLGGGGYVAGPVGLAAVLRRVPLVLTEADSHLGLTNRLLARFARRVCLAFPIDGRDEPRFRVTGRPGAGAVDRPGRARGPGSASRTTRCACSCSVARSGRRTINDAAVAGLADAPFRVLQASRPPRLRRAAGAAGRAAAAALRPRAVHPAVRRRAGRRATWWWRAPGARSSRSPRTGGRRCWCRIRTRRRTTRPRTRGGWWTRGRRWSCPTRELSGARLRSEVDRLLGDPDAPGRDGGGLGRAGPRGRGARDRRRGAQRGRAGRLSSGSGSSRRRRRERASSGAASQGRRPVGIPLGFRVVEDAGWR